MFNKKSTKRALLMSGLALIMCVSMLVGSTFAWFTDSVTSAGNKIQAGTLKLDLELLDKEEGWASIKESKAPIFDYDLWEPGYTDVKILKVENEGTLALKWYAKFISADDLSILADVIDVYVKEGVEEYPENRTDLSSWTNVGTVRDFVNTIETTTTGNLEAGAFEYLGIALKMQEEAGNDYQGLTLGAFDIMILAAQDTVEYDSFDDQYDANAEYDKVKLPAKKVTVTSAEEFEAALSVASAGDREMVIDATGVTVEITELMANGTAAAYEVPAGVTIKGVTFKPAFSRGGNYILMGAGANEQVVFENCNFDNAGNNFVIGSTVDGPDSVIYNNCTFNGQVITNFVDNPVGVAEFNGCRFMKATSGIPMKNYVQAMCGTHNFNTCTFDFTGVTQSSMGAVTSGCVNVYSESEYSTTVVLNGCTRINCGTRIYGSNSSLIVK